MDTEKEAELKRLIFPEGDGPYTPLYGKRTVMEDGTILLPIETDLGLSKVEIKGPPRT